MWRFMDDVFDSWLSVAFIIQFAIGMQDKILPFHGPGGWFDPDQLVIGRFGLSPDQELVQMGIWSMWSAPLIMSNDVDKLSERQTNLLKKEKLIKVNQDKLGIWAYMVHEIPEPHAGTKMQVFVEPIEPLKPESKCPSFVVAYVYYGALGISCFFSIKPKTLLGNSSELMMEANKCRAHPEWIHDCLELISHTLPNTKII